MKLEILSSDLNIAPEQFLKKAGYAFIYDRKTRKESFVRRLSSDYYPRFHVYVLKAGSNIIFNLHLDQKKSSYAGSSAHSAEYDGELVENEINRLKGVVFENKVTLNEVNEVVEKRGFIAKIFNMFK